jgi:hypothetical protein
VEPPSPLPAPVPAPAPAPQSAPPAPAAPALPTAVSSDAPNGPTAPTERNSSTSLTGAGAEDAARGLGFGGATPFDGTTQRIDISATPLRLPLRERDGAPGSALQFALADIAPGSPAVLISAWDEAGGRGGFDPSQRNTMQSRRNTAVEADTSGAERSGDGPHTPATLAEVIQDPLRISSVTFSAGFIWWLTRSGGLLTTMLMGIPAWRHIDLLPVLARPTDDEDDDEENDDELLSDLAEDDDDIDSRINPDTLAAADAAVAGLFDRGGAKPHSSAATP